MTFRRLNPFLKIIKADLFRADTCHTVIGSHGMKGLGVVYQLVKWSERSPRWSERLRRWSERSPKWSERSPKWSARSRRWSAWVVGVVAEVPDAGVVSFSA